MTLSPKIELFRLYNQGKVPIHLEKYGPRSRQILGDDCIQDCAGHAALHHDTAKSRRLSNILVVMESGR